MTTQEELDIFRAYFRWVESPIGYYKGELEKLSKPHGLDFDEVQHKIESALEVFRDC